MTAAARVRRARQQEAELNEIRLARLVVDERRIGRWLDDDRDGVVDQLESELHEQRATTSDWTNDNYRADVQPLLEGRLGWDTRDEDGDLLTPTEMLPDEDEDDTQSGLTQMFDGHGWRIQKVSTTGRPNGRPRNAEPTAGKLVTAQREIDAAVVELQVSDPSLTAKAALKLAVALSPHRVEVLKRTLDVPERTLRRWRERGRETTQEADALAEARASAGRPHRTTDPGGGRPLRVVPGSGSDGPYPGGHEGVKFQIAKLASRGTVDRVVPSLDARANYDLDPRPTNPDPTRTATYDRKSVPDHHRPAGSLRRPAVGRRGAPRPRVPDTDRDA